MQTISQRLDKSSAVNLLSYSKGSRMAGKTAVRTAGDQGFRQSSNSSSPMRSLLHKKSEPAFIMLPDGQMPSPNEAKWTKERLERLI